MNNLKYLIYCMVVGVILVMPVMAQSQTIMETVTLKAMVSETIALSVSPIAPQDNMRVEARRDVNDLTLTLSGTGPDVLTAQVSVLIRSNTSYSITGLVQSTAASLANLAVLDARPTGRFVARGATETLDVAWALDSRSNKRLIQTASLPLLLSSPLAILNGPRVSLAGTLDSGDNALEVTFLISVKPDAGADKWLLHLTFSGSARNRL